MTTDLIAMELESNLSTLRWDFWWVKIAFYLNFIGRQED